MFVGVTAANAAPDRHAAAAQTATDEPIPSAEGSVISSDQISGLQAVADDSPVSETPEELKRIEEMKRSGPQPASTDTQALLSGGLRLQTVREEALSLGMRAGLAWKYREIEKKLYARQGYCNELFDFSKVLIKRVILPPVIVKTQNSERLYDDESGFTQDVVYTIEYNARLVTTPPMWNDFLIKGYKPPENPPWAVLPKDDQEKAMWKEGTIEGWRVGVRQASLIYTSSLASLARLYVGMLIYHQLLESKMVSEPILARSDLGIEYQGHTLSIGDTLYRITRQPGFQSSQGWTPALRDETPVTYPH